MPDQEETLSQEEIFQQLNEGDLLAGGTIVEHREDEQVHGRIAYSGSSGYGAIGIGWSHDGGNRTTIFSHREWEASIIAGVIFLKKIREEETSTGCDQPYPMVNLYTLIPPEHTQDHDLRRRSANAKERSRDLLRSTWSS